MPMEERTYSEADMRNAFLAGAKRRAPEQGLEKDGFWEMGRDPEDFAFYETFDEWAWNYVPERILV